MAGVRDPFLDGLRAVSVVRVILLHLLQRVEHPFSANFSYFMPGMPLMFFVSGALAAKSLARDDVAARLRFWRERARRLFLPFWTFGAVVLCVCGAGAILWPDEAHAFPWESLWRWVVPLAGPQASAAYQKLNWHMWFISTLILMLATAPWTLALHRRLPGAGAVLFVACGAVIEVARIGVPDVVRNTLLFGAAFQLGYAYSDGRLQRMPRPLLLASAGALAIFAILFHAARAPGSMLHAVPLALVALGLGFTALWMALRVPMTRVFESARCSGFIRAINARAYTIFLWGPVANDLAWRLVRPASAAAYLLDFVVALGFLALFVRILGPVEDWAARRGPRPALVGPAAAAQVPPGVAPDQRERSVA